LHPPSQDQSPHLPPPLVRFPRFFFSRNSFLIPKLTARLLNSLSIGCYFLRPLLFFFCDDSPPFPSGDVRRVFFTPSGSGFPFVSPPPVPPQDPVPFVLSLPPKKLLFRPLFFPSIASSSFDISSFLMAINRLRD